MHLDAAHDCYLLPHMGREGKQSFDARVRATVANIFLVHRFTRCEHGCLFRLHPPEVDTGCERHRGITGHIEFG